MKMLIIMTLLAMLETLIMISMSTIDKDFPVVFEKVDRGTDQGDLRDANACKNRN